MAQWPSIDQVFQDDYEHENYCHLREELVFTHNKHTMKDTTNFHYSIGLRARNFIRLHRGILTPLRDLQDTKLGAAEQGKASAAFNGSKNKDLLKYIHNCVFFPDLVVSGFPWRHMTSSSVQTIPSSCNKDTRQY
jgi:hypothetical protein